MKSVLFVIFFCFSFSCLNNPVSQTKIDLDTCVVNKIPNEDSCNVSVKIGKHTNIIVQKLNQAKTTDAWDTYSSSKNLDLVFKIDDTLYVSWANIGDSIKTINFVVKKDTIITK